ncbi:MAG: hypothetical protein FWE47_02520 [Oscillospiraceae bacterium]|nr:hypothetical protein [Oscillospiraceae bacterium]
MVDPFALTKALGNIFGVIGILFIIFGATVIASGYIGTTGLERGWASRKKQGLIMCVAGALLWSTAELSKAATYTIFNGACTSFPFVTRYAPALGLALISFGIAQIALHWISDKFGDRIMGVRVIIGGAMVTQVGPVIDFLLR